MSTLYENIKTLCEERNIKIDTTMAIYTHLREKKQKESINKLVKHVKAQIDKKTGKKTRKKSGKKSDNNSDNKSMQNNAE